MGNRAFVWTSLALPLALLAALWAAVLRSGPAEPRHFETREVVPYDAASAEIVRDHGIAKLYDRADRKWHVVMYVGDSAVRTEEVDGKLKCWYDPPAHRPGMTQPQIEQAFRAGGYAKEGDTWVAPAPPKKE